jgi:hypothetical protein
MSGDPFAPYQNPLYPPDQPIPDMERRAREVAMLRANSPGQRVCVIDNVTALENYGHTHPYQECMDYRHNNVIGDSDPWTYWQLIDQAVGRFMPPVWPLPPVRPVGWQTVCRVNAIGIPYMDGWSEGWQGFTFTNIIGASRFQTGGFGLGSALRFTFQGQCLIGHIAVGPLLCGNPRVATALYPLLFGGSQTINIPTSQTITSDPFTTPIDVSNGLMISGYVADVSPGYPTAYLRTKTTEPDWFSLWIPGDHAADLDKSYGYTLTSVSVDSVYMIDAFY